MILTLTGGTGLLGQALVPKLLAEGHTVRLLSRSARTGYPAGVEPYLWDAASEFPRAALEGADAVIHLAGEPIAQRWTPAVKKALAVSRVDSTKLLVQALSALEKRPPILLSGSAIGFYGDRADEELDEGSAPGSGFLPELCREWENQANLARALGMRVNLLRTGIVLDPQGGALAQMLPPFRWGAGGKLGSGKQWMSWIHIADWVGAVLHLLAKDGESGPVNLTGPVPARNERFTEVLGKVLQRPALLPVPKFALELLFGEMAQIVLGSQQVLPRFLLRHGYEFRHPQLEGALRDLL